MSNRSLFALVMVFVLGTAASVRWYLEGAEALAAAREAAGWNPYHGVYVRESGPPSYDEDSLLGNQGMSRRAMRPAAPISGWTACPEEKPLEREPVRSFRKPARPTTSTVSRRSRSPAPLTSTTFRGSQPVEAHETLESSEPEPAASSLFLPGEG